MAQNAQARVLRNMSTAEERVSKLAPLFLEKLAAIDPTLPDTVVEFNSFTLTVKDYIEYVCAELIQHSSDPRYVINLPRQDLLNREARELIFKKCKKINPRIENNTNRHLMQLLVEWLNLSWPEVFRVFEEKSVHPTPSGSPEDMKAFIKNGEAEQAVALVGKCIDLDDTVIKIMLAMKENPAIVAAWKQLS